VSRLWDYGIYLGHFNIQIDQALSQKRMDGFEDQNWLGSKWDRGGARSHLALAIT